MKKRIYERDNFIKSKWSGGETTEFAIYPESSNYIERDFIWRLSSASVDVEESNFTRLPEYDRVLMVLEGEAVLAHGSERTVKLRAGQQDSFGGEAGTKCFGKIRDYNLMVRKGCSGRLTLTELESRAKCVEKSDKGEYTHCSYGFYCLDGYAVISVGEETHMLSEGRLMVLDFEEYETAEMTVMGEGRLIISEALYTKTAHAAVEIPQGKATFEDFKAAFKLARGRNKWNKMTKKKSRVWYDEALQSKLAFIDKTYAGVILWVAVSILLVVLAVKGLPQIYAVILLALWTVIYALIISPLIYLIILPKPINAHIKPVETLTEYERRLYEKELADNAVTDKLLKKYKHSKGEGWDVDDESIFSRIKK